MGQHGSIMSPDQRQRAEPDLTGRDARVSDLLAYLDLGSGSLIFQVIIATVVAVPFFVRGQIRRGLNSLRHRAATTAGHPTDAKDEPNRS